VILISDGGELEGDMSKMFASFEKEHIPVFAVGVGEPGTPSVIPVPGANGGKTLLKDRSGNTVNAPLEEKNLTAIAAKTGGIYIRSTTLDTGLAALQTRIRALTPDNGRTSTTTRAIERAAYPVTGALICLMIFFLTGETRRNVSALVLASMLLLSAWGNAQEPEKTEPPAVPEQQSEAPEKVQTALEMYNTAVKLQADGKAEEAVKQYERAVTYSQDQPEIRAKSYLNLGVLNHLAARGLSAASVNKLSAQQLDPAVQDIDKGLEQLRIAEENYRESLRAAPAEPDQSAALNQAILLRDRKQLEERKKQIEELKKQQQKARQQAQKALQDQQKKQKQDQQKQDQQGSTAQAKQEAEKLRDQADSMKQEQLKQSAQEAADKLDEAQKAQQKNDDKKAEEAMKEALRKLGADPDKKDQDKPENKQKQQLKQQEQKKPDQDQDKGKDQPQQAQPMKPAPEKKPEDQARENRLDQMRRENRNFRDELKERRQGTPALAPVGKDW